MNLKQHIKETVRLAVPVMLSQIGHMMVGVSDSIMVGRVGAIPLAAISLANSVFILILLFGIGVSYGLTPLVATAHGQGSNRDITYVLKNGMLLNIILGAVLSILCYFLSSILWHMDQTPEVVKHAVDYLHIIAYSMIPLMVFQTLRQLIEGMSLTKEVMKISLLGNVANIGLNYVLIYGHMGFSPMGLVGAGIATFISRVLMAAMLYGYYRKSNRFNSIRFHDKVVSIELTELKKILKIGLPTGVQFILEVSAFSGSAIIIGRMGTLPLASHQIAMNLASVTYMAATGFAAAGTIRVGNLMGSKNYQGVRVAGFTNFGITAAMMFLFALAFVFLRFRLPWIYISDGEVVSYAAKLLVIAAVFQLSDGVQAVGLGVLRGLADVKVPTLMTLIAYWGIAIPVGYVLGMYYQLEAEGVWVGLLSGLTMGAISHLIRFNKLTRELQNSKI
ncbi:MATE family efflux transporter [Reichenbachiella versicolor]|uniref:MATE family efflux transporter n=1 Tax=Reichenbachiella versicolor TaxID=1821036 RepID=UPI001FEC7DB0|nr:MATE family efflux transporter [Reichenbachiella versicolor]